jgi:hypothetical protein
VFKIVTVPMPRRQDVPRVLVEREGASAPDVGSVMTSSPHEADISPRYAAETDTD